MPATAGWIADGRAAKRVKLGRKGAEYK